MHYRDPRGFGFVQYYDPADAADAKYYMDGQVVLGRQITVVFAEENRKKPQEMRARDRVRFVGSSQCDFLVHADFSIHSFFFGCILQGSFL
jgi:RNA recognition motif-containing protein